MSYIAMLGIVHNDSICCIVYTLNQLQLSRASEI